jgi:2-oxoglutarate dehydrogenase E2 component (dihydrolipoamide succinyltransferase)
MAIEVKVPVLPESVSDATIATWHKKAGDAVSATRNLLDLETDKVVLEVPSPVDGVLKEIKFEAGATVTSQQVIAVIEEGAARCPPGRAGEGEAGAEPGRRSQPKAAPKAPPPAKPARRRRLANCRRARASPPRRKASTRRRSKARPPRCGDQGRPGQLRKAGGTVAAARVPSSACR